MKYFLCAGILILSLCLLLVSVLSTTDRYQFSDLLVSAEIFNDLKTGRIQTERDLLTAISFDDRPLFLDELTGRWFHVFTKEQTPTVGYSASEKNVMIAFFGKLLPGETLQVIAYDVSEYRIYEIAVTSLPLIRIECGDELFPRMNADLTAISADTHAKDDIPMKFTLYDNRLNAPQRVIVSDGTVHIRGGSTLDFPKKGLRIKLLEKGVGKDQNEYQIPLLGMRQDGDWILYSAYNDQEKVRNVFSSNLWFNSCADDNSFGIKNGMEYRFVELFINNQYWGLYALGYPIDAEQMDIHPDNFGHYDEFLFQQKAFGPDLSDIENGVHGYLLQFDADESDQNNGSNILKMFFSLLVNDESAGLWHCELKNAADIWLYLKLCQAYDTVRIPGQLKNVMYTIKMTNEGRKILFTPWDADNYWGNVWQKDALNKTIPYGLTPDDNSYEMTVNPISILLGKQSWIDQMVKDRYTELRADGWSDETINNMLDELEQDIFGSGAYLRDMERWPDGTYEDPDLGLSVFRGYVHDRLKSMDNYMEKIGE